MEYYWESMTVRQMGELLRNFDLANKEEGWSKFIDLLEAHDRPIREHKRVKEIGELAKVAGSYFLTFVAAICEGVGNDSRLLEIATLEEEYHLKEIMGAGDYMSSFLKLYLGMIVTSSDVEGRSSYDKKCIEQIQKYLAKWNMIDSGTSLRTLLNQIKLSNQDASREENEQALEDSIESFTKQLNAWDKTCKETWEQYIKAIFPDNECFRTICALLENGVKQIILTGAPGTGKTYLAGQAARFSTYLDAQQAKEPYVRTLFHPSYDYTDFVEGLRPVETGSETPAFVKLDGQFKAFCRWVVEEGAPNQKYFFLIDEINRADLSKVFGELMFCLESDKRGEENRIQTQYQNLPTYRLEEAEPDGQKSEEAAYRLERLAPKDDVFADGFYVPENVYIIGTMNDIDRSVESMDFALRRRFTWIEVNVDESLLKSAFQSGKFGDLLRDKAKDAAARIMALNAVICRQGKDFGLNEQYYISQGQFSGLPKGKTNGSDLDGLFQFVWDYRIQSLLREYIRGVDEKEVESFLTECGKEFGVEVNQTDSVSRSGGQQKG